MTRGYQPGFYQLDARVRDEASRNRQANKIGAALMRYGGSRLEESVCLDVGCSAGLITRAVAPLVRGIIGIDYDEVALNAIAHAHREGVLFVRGDAMDLPLSSESVGVVICAQVYEHVPDADRLFAEIHRVLCPGGIVFFSGPNALYPVEPHYHIPFLQWLPGPVANRLLALVGRGGPYYERLRTPWGMRRMVRGLEVRDITLDVLKERYVAAGGRRSALLRAVPDAIWRALLPVMPNYNWILYKRPQGNEA